MLFCIVLHYLHNRLLSCIMPIMNSFAHILLRFTRGLLAATSCMIALVLFVCVLIVVQGQRDEARVAGAALVAPTGSGTLSLDTQAHLERTITLYRRGTVGRVILAAASTGASTEAQKYLTSRGMAAEVVLVTEPRPSPLQAFEQAAVLARTQGINAVLVIGGPWEMLRSLKIAQDLDLNAYGVPARPPPAPGWLADDTRGVVREAWAYLNYIFLRR